MATLLAVDLGTSSIKVSLFQDNVMRASEHQTYSVLTERIHYAEQNPEEWWLAFLLCMQKLRAKQSHMLRQVQAIGFSGQMHGLVCVDASLQCVRPAIIWLDSRSVTELELIRNSEVYPHLLQSTLNQPAAGFAFTSLLWMQKHEPRHYESIYKIMHPKDYLRMKLSGEIATDESDASASGIFDTVHRKWLFDVIEKFSLRSDIFPDVYNACDVVGKLQPSIAEEIGLQAGIPLVAGAGDQPCYCIGNGLIQENKLSLNIGSSGQVSGFARSVRMDNSFRTQTFCHAIRDAYSVFAATLCAGMSLNWAKHKLFDGLDYARMDALAETVAAGSEGVIYLPYLSGERSPIMNPNAKAMFFGLRLHHDRSHMLRAMMEGVVYSLYHGFEALQERGFDADSFIASGAGIKSRLWLQMQADVFDKPIYTVVNEEQATAGAAILAGLGIGLWKDYEQACAQFVQYREQVALPDAGRHSRYMEGFAQYKALYEQTKNLMG